jgi:hypothetical protein
MKKWGYLFFLIIVVSLLGACGTTKKYNVQSDPAGALVSVHETQDINTPDISGQLSGQPFKAEVTPLQKSVWFIKDETRYISVEKRGYRPSLQAVTQNSALEVNFKLERVEGVSEESEWFDKNKLKTSTVGLLPVEAEVVIHSGVGRMDKNTYSPEISQSVSQKLNEALEKAFLEKNQAEKRFTMLDPALKNSWTPIAEQAKGYLGTLHPVRLPYYTYPPLLISGVTMTQSFFDQLKQSPENACNYLYYFRVKCVSETKGRVVGNFFLGLAGATMQGVSVGFYYDPSAFYLDSGTLVTLYVMDTTTSEVCLIEQQYFSYDITKDEDLGKLVNLLSGFPEMEKSK